MSASSARVKVTKAEARPLASRRDMVCVGAMTRSSSLVDRPVLRLLLLALMGLALASRLALGATLPVVGDGASAIGPLAKLQAEMIMCHTGHDGAPAPPMPRGPLLSDLLVFDQADNTHALAGGPVAVLPPPRHSSDLAFVAVHAAGQPSLWRAKRPARGPPLTA
jgi:hypothetical protein